MEIYHVVLISYDLKYFIPLFDLMKQQHNLAQVLLSRGRSLPIAGPGTSHTFTGQIRFVDDQFLEIQNAATVRIIKSSLFILTADLIDSSIVNHNSSRKALENPENGVSARKLKSILIIGAGFSAIDNAAACVNLYNTVWIAHAGARLISELNENTNNLLKAALKKMNINVISEICILKPHIMTNGETSVFISTNENTWTFRMT